MCKYIARNSLLFSVHLLSATFWCSMVAIHNFVVGFRHVKIFPLPCHGSIVWCALWHCHLLFILPRDQGMPEPQTRTLKPHPASNVALHSVAILTKYVCTNLKNLWRNNTYTDMCSIARCEACVPIARITGGLALSISRTQAALVTMLKRLLKAGK